MSTPATRSPSTFSELLNWLEHGLTTTPRTLEGTQMVRVEDFVEGGTYVLRAEMPGIDPDKDVELTVLDGALTIRGERREEKKDKNHREFQYGAFSRRIPLPRSVDVEDIKASYLDGVLEVRFPVNEAPDESRKIPVGRG